jgi:hypothetical protein
MHSLGTMQSVAWLVRCVIYTTYVREMGLVQPALKLASSQVEILGQSSLVWSLNKLITNLTSNTC